MADISIENLNKSYGKTQVIRDFSLNIKSQSFTTLVGPSGCGKSTLLRMIAGLESITSGNISIDGRLVNDLSPKERNIAMVFQSYALYPHMTVFDNMAFGLKLEKRPKEEIQDRVQEAAKILQIEQYLQRKPKQLSGGQRQRVAIGRAITRKPKVFLFDEPLSNLDAKLRAELRYEIKKLHRDLSNTMIYVTHDQIEAMTLADRISVMKDGLIQQLDTPKQIYNKPANLFVAGFIGSPSMNFLRAKFDNSNQYLLIGKKQINISKYENINNLIDDQEVVYNKDDIEQLNLAYAISVHKAQGSEYDIVMMPLVKSYMHMFKKELIYTAMTRAKSHLLLLGDMKLLMYAANHVTEKRQTLLKQFLNQDVSKEEKPLSPYDFM